MGKRTARAKASQARLSSSNNVPMSSPDFKLNVSDNREFPSLSGAPQAQQNTSAQQMWSNPNLRSTPQHSTIQRPQGQGAQQGQTGQVGPQPIQTSGHDDVGGSAPGQFSAGSDDYRFGGQAGVGQLSGSSQPQTGNIEEFPPLGGSGGDAGPDRRTGLIQNAAAYGANAGAGAFPGLGQTRNGLSSPTEGQQDRQIGSGLGRGINPSSGMCPRSY
jgi:CCR4-NOT transcription complex subunit 2